ncbi:hypothetical protein I4U23_014710 [Adineta vaga]|nr:hypothetical protein I4U23_014710 [Adineta vaga]
MNFSNRHRNIVSIFIAPNTEVTFCTELSKEDLVERKTLNGFGLYVFKKTYRQPRHKSTKQLSSVWLLFNPCAELKNCRNNKRYDRIVFEQYTVTLVFGALTLPYVFQCAGPKFLYKKHRHSTWNIYFARHDSFITINMNNMVFKLKHDHIDMNRGVIIDTTTTSDFTLYVCLKNNLDEYISQNQTQDCTRRFYLPNTCDGKWQPSFSTLRFSIHSKDQNTLINDQCLKYFIQYFTHHSIPIYFGSINFLDNVYIYENDVLFSTYSFIIQYGWYMLTSINCRIYHQMVSNVRGMEQILQLANENDDQRFYYVMERLQRLATAPENYFLDLPSKLPDILCEYEEFYLYSTYYKMDQCWENYVRIPWFRFTPTRRLINPFKFMKSNRVFRYVKNVTKCMAFVDFRDDTGSEFISSELIPFLEYYLRHGFHFANRHYVYLHHAQSQVRKKQFYFYCEEEGDMTREELEKWMGDFDVEKVPAKNTARRTQPFSSTDDTIEINGNIVDTISDIKTDDKKYNFTDGVGQISSELNLEIHYALGIDIDNDGYISSVLQIRYGGCKGTLAVNPQLDEQDKQLLIRPSMKKFECKHTRLEVCKRSLRRRLCLNREVINLLSYRGISSECLLIYQLQNIRWLIEALIFNRSALVVFQEKVLHILPWSEISSHQCLYKEPFFRRLLLKTIFNNLHQLVTRAHIRVPQARYMFGIVDEYRVLQREEVFVQITYEDGTKIVLEGPIAITKNPCHHPGDLLVLQAVNKKCLHHLYDVLVFPQQGSRPHSSEISGSDLDGDEYTVIWDTKLVPISSNPPSYAYDSEHTPEPLDRIVTRDDRLKVILDICEQDNVGKLSTLHLIFVDKFGIDSDQAIRLAGGISQELDSVKSGHHPYTTEEIRKLTTEVGTKRPDFMQATNYEQYQSEKVLGKLFRSINRLMDTFSQSFIEEETFIDLDLTLLHKDYEKYTDFAEDLYKQYKFEMMEIIRSYGFSNEIDLFCCIESHNMKANERSDIQYTAQELLKAVFGDIRKQFLKDTSSFHEKKAKASACYFVAYNDHDTKDGRMLSFPWLFASQLLSDYSIDPEDEEMNMVIINKAMHTWLKSQAPSLLDVLPKEDSFSCMEILDIFFDKIFANDDDQMVDHAETLLKRMILLTKNTCTN